MILTCPQCATQYRVDAAKFPASGRNVRCQKCSHVWHQDAPVAEPVPEPAFVAPDPVPIFTTPEPRPARAAYVAPEPVYESEPDVEAEPRQPSRWAARLGLGFGWVALVGVVLVIGFASFVWRQQVAQAWPRSASLYAALGVKVNAVGIGFADVTHSQETEDGQAVLSIAGKLVNLSHHKVSVPPIEVTLTDAGRHEVLRKSFAPGVAALEPGQIASFLARLSSPPAAARHMELRFAGQ
ncbi:MAG TPA: DUF3426 domain-containing protein [Rhizomicrobium sp.]|jgi:predicted Zn finger-like uncharacterized protein|nr:DUF3426 domain-containing protein [Rhizomicrobium sp.]